MEDEEDEDNSNFQTSKASKVAGSLSFLGHSPHRKKPENKKMSLSLKSTRSKNKGIKRIGSVSLTRFLDKKFIVDKEIKKDTAGFCPACQVPFTGLVGQSPQDHVLECLENMVECTVECQDGINCKSVNVEHFKQFLHQGLANARSIKEGDDQSKRQKDNENKSGVCKDIWNCDSSIEVSPGSDCSRDTNNSNSKNNNSSARADKLSFTTTACKTRQDVKEENTKSSYQRVIAVQSPKQEETNNQSNRCTDDFSKWFNDDLDLMDIEMFDGTNDSDTKNSSSTCSSKSQGGRTSAESLPKMFDVGKKELKGGQSANGRQKKQMDIGVFFGLKPKQNVDKVRSSTPESSEIKQETIPPTLQKANSRTKQHRKCPFYKIVDGTSFAVDAFSYGNIPGVSAYFLSHFHYDHYGGLTKSFSNAIYCSKITANLISLKIKVAAQFIHPLPLHTHVKIQNIEITLLEANHCPGAVMFLFKLPNGKTHLHTGDFRASPMMEVNPFLCSSSIHTLYLDTTYCDPDYSFPAQLETVDYCVSLVRKAVLKNPKTLIVVGTYTIGKEKIFRAVAESLQCKVGVRRDKYNILQCLESNRIKEITTQNYSHAQVHVLPMGELTHKKLAAHLVDYSSCYREVLAIKPTGWTFTDTCKSELTNIKPSKRGVVTIYGVPYSEHSSFGELERFVKFIKPFKIIPTVNNGSATSRDDMNQIFTAWLKK